MVLDIFQIILYIHTTDNTVFASGKGVWRALTGGSTHDSHLILLNTQLLCYFHISAIRWHTEQNNRGRLKTG